MAVYRTIEEVRGKLNRPIVAIGNFDGVHRGHQTIFRAIIERARAEGVDAAVLTFEPHPVRFFRPDAAPFRLTTPEQRFEVMEELGLDAVVALPFDDWMRELDPKSFVDEILRDALSASCVAVGEGFVFGKKRAGNTDFLKSYGGEHGIDTMVLDPVLDETGEVISSTRIRKALADGDLMAVNSLLGRPYAVSGTVVHGDARGRNLGFPTANIDSPNPLLPHDGIYATWLDVPGMGRLPSATYVGHRPTFETEGRTIEAFVLDAPEGLDLYEKAVHLHFVGHVRGDARFDSADELIAQMNADVARAREILAED